MPSTLNRCIWLCLEAIPRLVALLPVWRKWLGGHLPAFQAAFLHSRPDPAQSFPCPCPCGYAHRVIPNPTTSPPSTYPPVLHSASDEGGSIHAPFLAVCQCDPARCPVLQLSLPDITIWELNWPKLGRALCKALLLNSKPAELGLPQTAQIGSWSADAVPVILTIQNEFHELRTIISELALRLQKPFILLAPTSDLLDATNQELLTHAGAAFFALESIVLLTAHGALHPKKPPGELFAQFTPQPKDPLPEDAARRAFALVQQLDSEGPAEPPTVLTVFRLYCMEELSADQIAKKCRCSKLTVLRRLKLIRAKTGADPQDLRRLSPHLDKIEDDITDPRAARIHRKRLIYDDPDADEPES